MKPLIIINKRLFFFIFCVLSISTWCYSKDKNYNSKGSNQDTLFVVDTLVVYDTISVPKKIIVDKNKTVDINSNTSVEKIATDSIADSEKAKQLDINKTHNAKEIRISIADYMELGMHYCLKIKKIFGMLGLGINFNKQLPAIVGIGGGYNIPINKKITFQPNIMSYLYIPLSFNFGTTSYNHIRLGFSYKFSNKLALDLEPSFYYSPKSNIIDNQHYSNIIAYVSPLNPIYSKQISTSKNYDLGIGISIGVEFITE